MSATDELRELLDAMGVEWGNIRNDGSESDYLTEWQFENNQGKAIAIEWVVGSGLSVEIHRYHLTPEQVIEATLGRGTCQKVYLVETSDDLIESWHPIGVYLNSKAAGDCAEALRGEVDGIRQFARVVELKVVDE